jgi:uncharacterized repeat protein (TIGR01451 family)
MKFLQNILATAILSFAATQAAQAQCTIPVMVQDSSWQCDSTVMLQAFATQGTAPFSYLWSNGQTTSSLWNAPRGVMYSVTMTDAAGCMGSASFFAQTNNGAPQITGTILQQGCNANGLGGAASVTVTGGVPPYTYQWSNGSSTASAQNLPGGAYLYVTDAAGCSAYYNPNISGIQVYQPYTQPASCNQNNGTASAYASGNYSFLWSNGQTGYQATGLAAGWYGLTISELGGGTCTYSMDFNVGYDPNCETTITGNVYNATSTGTCIAGLPSMYTGWVRLQNGTNTYYGSVINGAYSVRTRVPGTYTLTYYNYYGSTTLATLCPNVGSYTVTTNASGGTNSGNDFYITYPSQNDVSVDVYTGGAAPGFNHYEYVRVCNNGGNNATGTVDFHYDPILGAANSVQIYNSYYYGIGQSLGTMSVTSQNATNGTINFSYANLTPGTCQSAYINFTLPTNVALGTQLITYAIANQTGDTNASNNVDTASTVVVGSYDPNDKRMMRHRTGDDYEGGIYEQDNNLEYVVRFQNTGTAAARRVVIRDTLETNLRPETVANFAFSHDGVAYIQNGNILVVEFNNIYLPDSASDLAGSQGYVKFNIMRTAGLALGTSIENSAAIYFDYNSPIITNTAISTLEAEIVSVENLTNAMQVQVMPNPFDAQLTAQYELPSQSKVTVRLYNALGQVAVELAPAVQAAGQQNVSLNTANLTSGIYWLQIESAQGKYTQKVVKQ